MNIKGFILILLCLLGAAVGCNAENQAVLSGKTMGTTWRIVIAPGEQKIPDTLKAKVVKRLGEINRSMSLFDKNSELSRFNGIVNGGEKLCVSEDFISVYRVAGTLYELTDGAWDGTVGPLVNLWGFGSSQRAPSVPTKEAIQAALTITGFDKIKRVGDHCLVKETTGLVLDFGSVAKGYGVDAVSRLFQGEGFKNFLVEIGGEVYASGTKSGKQWTVGIKAPEMLIASEKIYNTTELENMAIATSGDYRNFREIDGQLYSHIIHPATGKPLTNKIASVSVTAKTATFADGLATALMVMGVTNGLKLVESLADVESLIIVRTMQGRFIAHPSSGWK